MTADAAAAAILADPADTAAAREALYKDLHRHPELSMEEHRTSGVIADELARMGVEDIPIGVTGRVGVIRNGAGTHGSMPNLGVDPIVLGAAIVGRLQTIVSREVAPTDTAVVTVGSFHGGTKSNIIPDSVTLLVNTRAYDTDVAERLHAAIERIVRAECDAARSPKAPEFRYYDQHPLTINDDAVTDRVRAAFDGYFGDDSVDMPAAPASEDFSIIPDAFGTPYCYWGLGGFADMDSAPGNHSPKFAPDIQPTLDRGAQAIVVAASAWLAAD